MTPAAAPSAAGNNIIDTGTAIAAPMSCARIKPGTSPSAMPANVVVKPRASVTAGLANEVEEVNQRAAVMVSPTSHGTAAAA